MKSLFDYIYYRVMVFYHKKKDSTSQFTAALVLSLVQFFILVDIFVIVRIIYEYPFPANFNKYWALFIAVPLGYINWHKYVKGQVSPSERAAYLKRWKAEDLRKRQERGIGVVALIIFVIIIPIVYGFVRHNILGNKSFL